MDVQNTVLAYQVGFEICGAVFCIVCLLMSTAFKGLDKRMATYLRSILGATACNAVFEALAIGFDGSDTRAAFFIVRISNFLVFFFVYLTTALGLLYFKSLVLTRISSENHSENIENSLLYSSYIGSGICAFGVILLIASQFEDIFYSIDENNAFQALQPAFLLQLIPGMVLFIAFFYTIRYLKFLDNPEKRSIIAAFILALSGLILVSLPGEVFPQRISGGVFAEIVAITLFAGFISASAVRAVKREQIIAAKDAAIKEQKIRIMQNQIRPHFIFNSLLAIKQLCIEEPRQAADSLQHFSGFLRANLEAMTDEKPVPIEKEIDCIKEYVALEQADPANRFTINYDIAYTDFKVPLLSVEPMVENAIRHGIATNRSEGIVKVSTAREGDTAVVTVEDNGLGFGSETAQQAEHRSIGIQNSKDRLRFMCDGEISIVNTGHGTIVRITIPLEPDDHTDETDDSKDEEEIV